MTKTFIPERPNPDGTMGKVEVDDAFAAVVEFENGAIGTLEATRFAAGRKNYNCLEINGEKGSIHFNLERMNELEVFWVDEQPKETQGFHKVIVTEGYHPWISNWWPHGHIIGWEHTFVHEITSPAGLHREQQGRGALRRNLRGWLSQRRGLRCDRRVCRHASGRSI